MMDREKEDRNAVDKGGGQWRGNKTQGVTNVELANQVLTSVVMLEIDQSIFVVMEKWNKGRREIDGVLVVYKRVQCKYWWC